MKDIRVFQEYNHLLGDAVYTLTQWFLTPYKDYGTTTRAERTCNYGHSATGMPIERAFAILKGRWRKLKYVNIAEVVDIPNIIRAACVLHNICLISDND